MSDLESIFRARFLEASPLSAARCLADDGYWVAEGVLRMHTIEEIERDLVRPVPINENDVGPVVFGAQTYFTHALACSRSYFDVVTHPQIRAIAGAHIGALFRLKCQRYVINRTGFVLPWHTDNKTSVGVRTAVRGVGIVIYLRDTYEGELQVIRGSQRWSLATGRTEFDDDVAHEHSDDVVTLSCRAGSVVFFDTLTLHRTRKIEIPGHQRPSIFLQIDADLEHSEKIIVNTEFADPNDAELMRYLGVGLPSGYPIMPPAGIATLEDVDLVRLMTTSSKELIKRRIPARLRTWVSRARRALR